MGQLQTASARITELSSIIEGNFKTQLTAALAGTPCNYAKLKGTFLNLLAGDDKLANCTTKSLLRALFNCAQTGLYADGLGNRAHIIAYKQEATFQPGYMGLKELAERHPSVRVCRPPEVIYENDKFEIELGLVPVLRHKPALGERGVIVGAYCVADLVDANPVFVFLRRDELDERMNRSPAVKRGAQTPWKTDFAAMCKKTAIIELAKRLPSQPEMDTAIELERRASEGLPPAANIVDATFAERPSGPINSLDALAEKSEAEASCRLDGDTQIAPAAKSDKPNCTDKLYSEIAELWMKMSNEDKAPVKNNFSFKMVVDVKRWKMSDAQDLLDHLRAEHPLEVVA